MGYDFRKQMRSFRYAWKGIVCCIGKEQNLTFHLFAATLVLVASICFDIEKWEWVAVILCCGMVIAAEFINTAIEGIVDLVSPEWRKEAGRIKDIAAGAVLVTAIAAAIVGVMIFLPYVLDAIS